MASDKTWSHIHRKYPWVFLAAAALLMAMGIDLAISCILTRAYSDTAEYSRQMQGSDHRS